MIKITLIGLALPTLAIVTPRSGRALPPEVPSALTPNRGVTLNGEAEVWRERALAWYQAPDLKRRRRQMRDMSRPLKRPCYYCHTRSFKGYVDETYLISLQMMAISAEQGVSCADCHQGRRGLTALGAKSLIQWRSSAERGQDCRECHQPQGRFRVLTAQGAKARRALIDELPSRGQTLGLSPELISEWSRELKRALVDQDRSQERPQETPPQVKRVDVASDRDNLAQPTQTPQPTPSR